MRGSEVRSEAQRASARAEERVRESLLAGIDDATLRRLRAVAEARGLEVSSLLLARLGEMLAQQIIAEEEQRVRP